jgi:hypothetical protein
MGLDQNLTVLNSFLENFNSLSKPMSCSYIQSIAASFLICTHPPPPLSLCSRLSAPHELRDSSRILFDQPMIRKKLLLKQPHIISSFGSIAGGGGGGVNHKVSSLPTVQTESVLGLGRAAAAAASVNNLGSSRVGSCKKFGSAVVGARCFTTTIMAEPNKERIKEILASNLDPADEMKLPLNPSCRSSRHSSVHSSDRS